MNRETTLSRKERIAQSLREDIYSGRIKDGDHLSETKLAERFGVSRGPIREALQQLTHEGLLLAKRNCGVTVAPTAPKSIRQLIVPIRRAIELYALRQIFDDLNEADFRAWGEILERLRQACQERDFTATAELDIAFHRSLLARAGQPDLQLIWQTILARIRDHFRKSHTRYQDPMLIYEEHRALVECFRQGDEQAALKMLKQHIA
jgi:DNA-binding GntR family transcriptional regulator